MTFGPLALSYIHSVGYLEKRSIAARKDISLPFSSKIGPPNQFGFLDSIHGTVYEVKIP